MMSIVPMVLVATIAGVCWSVFRRMGLIESAEKSTPVATPAQRATPTTTVLALEDDPDLWPAARGAWTALDERQLIRLLTDAAPADRQPTDPKDLRHVDHEDTA